MDTKLLVGMWTAYNEEGLVENWDGEECGHIYCWSSKKTVLFQLQVSHLDPRKKPKISRIGPGKYEYTPGDCDNPGHDADCTYILERITKENFARLSALIPDADELM